jgi:hypothetical protein
MDPNQRPERDRSRDYTVKNLCRKFGIDPIPNRGDPLTAEESKLVNEPPANLSATTLTCWIKLGMVAVEDDVDPFVSFNCNCDLVPGNTIQIRQTRTYELKNMFFRYRTVCLSSCSTVVHNLGTSGIISKSGLHSPKSWSEFCKL